MTPRVLGEVTQAAPGRVHVAGATAPAQPAAVCADHEPSLQDMARLIRRRRRVQQAVAAAEGPNAVT